MSGVSFQEFFLLLVIGLVVLGPKRLPQVANQLGSWLGQARRMTRMMKRQLEDEINVDLDSFNVQKQLGLDKDKKAPTTGSVSSPSYVHDPKRRSGNPEKPAGQESDAAAAAKEELPDDYSPAHAADDVGTGVDEDPAETGRRETTAGADTDSAGDDATEPMADKKEPV